jgi:hypothetical protein
MEVGKKTEPNEMKKGTKTEIPNSSGCFYQP